MIIRGAGALLALVLSAGLAQAQAQPEAGPARPPAKPQLDQPASPATEMTEAPAPPARPEREPLPEPEAEPEPKPEISGPPLRETLRESDFDHAACLLALHDLGTRYETLPQIDDPDQRDCGIARPIRVTEIMPGIALIGGASMRCDTARNLGFWIRDFVRPAAGRLPGAPQLKGLQLGTTYDCRSRIGTDSGAKLSEHALGNAIDIAAFLFRDAEPIPVQPRRESGDLIEAFQRTVRGAACLTFTTVLGPGSNAAHDNHLHLDIAARNGGWRLCQ